MLLGCSQILIRYQNLVALCSRQKRIFPLCCDSFPSIESCWVECCTEGYRVQCASHYCFVSHVSAWVKHLFCSFFHGDYLLFFIQSGTWPFISFRLMFSGLLLCPCIGVMQTGHSVSVVTWPPCKCGAYSCSLQKFRRCSSVSYGCMLLLVPSLHLIRATVVVKK